MGNGMQDEGQGGGSREELAALQGAHKSMEGAAQSKGKNNLS